MPATLTDENYIEVIQTARGPLMICFMSSFCGPSHLLFPELDDLLDETQNAFAYFEVDVEKCPKLTRACEVKGTPSLVWFHKGQPLGSRVGTMSAGFLKAFVTDMLERSKQSA